MKIKVCGMRQAENIANVAALEVDYLGFIFYEKSPRFIHQKDKTTVSNAVVSAKKVGVFVNEALPEVVRLVGELGLNAVQLHGKEDVDYVKGLRHLINDLLPLETEIIKAFSVDETFDFQLVTPYLPFVNYLLFDTKTPKGGGSGVKFDWSILKKYTGSKPFFLAGGITEADAEVIKKLQTELPQLYAVDLNSRFEIEPAFKNVASLERFIGQLKNI